MLVPARSRNVSQFKKKRATTLFYFTVSVESAYFSDTIFFRFEVATALRSTKREETTRFRFYTCDLTFNFYCRLIIGRKDA